MRSKRLPSPALVISVIALFIGFTGGAVAAVKVTGKQIKDGSITGKDIRNDSLTATDIKGQLQGPTGPTGPRGPAGPPGSPGGTGPVTYRSQLLEAQPGEDTLVTDCPDGLVAIGGGTFLTSRGAVTVDSERPAAYRAGSGVPSAWEVDTFNTSDDPVGVMVTAVCVAGPGVVTADSPA